MNSQILPISNPSSSLAIPTGAAATMFLTSQDDLSAIRLLISPQFDDDKPTEVKPFLPRSSSFTTTTPAVADSSPNLVVLPQATFFAHCGTLARAAHTMFILLGDHPDSWTNSLAVLAIKKRADDEFPNNNNAYEAELLLSQFH